MACKSPSSTDILRVRVCSGRYTEGENAGQPLIRITVNEEGRQTRKRATTGRHGIQSQTDVRQQENGGGVFLIHCGGRVPFSAREWAEFVGRVKRGAFDRPAA